MTYTIDRIEDNMLVLEDEKGNIINYELNTNVIAKLHLKDGDMISFDKHGEITILDIDKDERNKLLAKKVKDLWNY